MGKAARNDPILRNAIVFSAQAAGAALGTLVGIPPPVGGAIGGTTATMLIGPPDTKLDVADQLVSNRSQATNKVLQLNERANVGGVIPKVWGIARLFPKLIADPAIVTVGGEEYLTAIYDLGLGDAHAQAIKSGDIPLTGFPNVRVRLVNPGHASGALSVDNRTVQRTFEDFTILTIQKAISGQAHTGDFTYIATLTPNEFPNGTWQQSRIYIVFPRGLKPAYTGGHIASVRFDVEYKRVTETSWKPYMQLYWGQSTAPNIATTYSSSGFYSSTPALDARRAREANYFLRNSVNTVPFHDASPSTIDMTLSNPATNIHNRMVVMYNAYSFGATGNTYNSNDLTRQLNNSGLIKLPSDFNIQEHESYNKRGDAINTYREWWGFPKGTRRIQIRNCRGWLGPESVSANFFRDSRVYSSPDFFGRRTLLRGQDRRGQAWEEEFGRGGGSTDGSWYWLDRTAGNFIKKGALLYLDYWDFFGRLSGSSRTHANWARYIWRQWGARVLHAPVPVGVVRQFYHNTSTGNGVIILENPLKQHEPMVGFPAGWQTTTPFSSSTLPLASTLEGQVFWSKRMNTPNDWGGAGFNVKDFARDYGAFSTTLPLIFVNQHPRDVAIIGNETYPKSEAQIAMSFPNKASANDNYQVRLIKTHVFTNTHGLSGNIDDTTIQSSYSSFNTPPVRNNRSQLYLQCSWPRDEQFNTNEERDVIPADINAEVLSLQKLVGTTSFSSAKNQSTNPADIVADILTSDYNKNKVPLSSLDFTSFKKYKDFCNAVPVAPSGRTFTHKRFEMGFLVDYQSTVSQLLHRVLAATRAGLRFVNGKWEVFLDETKDPIQVFTPRNSWGFSAQREYRENIDFYNVSFFDGWELNNTKAYQSAALTGTVGHDVQAFGCRSQEQAWRYGRYLIAQHKYRRESFRLNVDYEHLICHVGDRVQIAFDQIKGGGHPTRIKNIAGGVYTISPSVPMASGVSYKALIRTVKSDDASGAHVYEADVTTLTPATVRLTIPSGKTPPVIGDLIVIGEATKVKIDCQVKSISPSDDLSAALELVEYNENIFNSESSGTLTPYQPLIHPERMGSPTNDLTLIASLQKAVCSGSQVSIPVKLNWTQPTSGRASSFKIERSTDGGGTWTQLGTSTTHEYTTNIVFASNAWNTVRDTRYRVSATGATGTAPIVQAIYPYAQQSHVAASFLNGTPSGSFLALRWDASEACFNAGTEIKYSPTDTNDYDSLTTVASLGANRTNTTVPLQNGFYYLKLIDPFGNKQPNPVEYNVSVDNPFGDVVSYVETDDWAGSKEGLVIDTLVDRSKVLELRSPIIDGLRTGKYFFAYQGGQIDLGAEFQNVQVEIALTAVNNQELVLNSFVNLNEIIALSQPHLLSSGLFGWGGHIVVSSQPITEASVVINQDEIDNLALIKNVEGRYIRPVVVAWSKRFGVRPYFTAASFKIRMRKNQQTKYFVGNTQRIVNVTWDQRFFKITQADVGVQVQTQGVGAVVSNVTVTGCTVTLTRVSDFTIVANGYGEPA